MMENNKALLGNISQIKMFGLGIVAGVLVLCTVGFFILLGVVLKGGTLNNMDVVKAGDTGKITAPEGGDVKTSVPAVDKNSDHKRGGENAKVTLIEYSDFECSFCSRFNTTLKQALDEYGDDIRVVYRHFPLSFHAEAQPSAEASECAGEQGKFWEFHDEMFENQTSLGSDLYVKTAKDLGLNMTKFNDCVSSGKYTVKVQQQMAGGSAAGVGGTPHTIVMDEEGNSVIVSGAQLYSNLKSTIDSMLD